MYQIVQIVVEIAIPFVSTFFGVFLAYLLSKRREKRNAKQEKQEKTRNAKQILIAELRKIKESLDGMVDLMDKNGKYYTHPDIPQDAKDSIVGSGYFSLLTLDVQRDVSHVYIVIKRMKNYLDRIREYAIEGKSVPKLLEELFIGQVQHLQDNIPSVIKILEK